MSDSGGHESQPKRKRTAQACAPCRTKKTKCDGLGPPCSPCTYSKIQCSYPLISTISGGRNSVLISKDYLHALEDRIKRLEGPEGSAVDHVGQATATAMPSSTARGYSQARDTVPASSAHPINSFSYNGDSFPTSPHGISQPHRDSAGHAVVPDPLRPGTSPFNDTHSRYSGFSPNDQSGRQVMAGGTDGMGMLPPFLNQTNDRSERLGSDFRPGSETEVYGRTSGVSFHRLLLDTLLPGYQALAPEDPSLRWSGMPGGAIDEWPMNSDTLSPASINIKDLPDPQEAASIWVFYFAKTHQIYPYLSESAIKAGYVNALSLGPVVTTKDIPQLALQAVVFSLALRASGRTLPGKDVHRLALSTLSNHTSWPHSLLKVQVLLLAALTLQSFDSPSAAWDVVGMAVRAAYAIGLHDEDTTIGLSHYDRQMRIRAWWMCFTLDRLLTVTMGRPSAITARGNLPFPKALPDEDPTITNLFNESIRLYQALSPLIDEPPNLSSAQRASPEFAETAMLAVSQLERNYALWADSVPRDLNIDSYPDAKQASPQAAVLALRSLTLRLLLHRPIIVAAVRRQNNVQSRAASPTGQHRKTNQAALESRSIHLSTGTSISAVVATAVQMVRILNEMDLETALNARWYQLSYCLNAFMSLVAVITLDLSKWTSFLTTPAEVTIPTLFMARDAVVRIAGTSKTYPPAQRALWIIDKLLEAMHLEPPRAHRETAAQAAGSDLRHSALQTSGLDGSSAPFSGLDNDHHFSRIAEAQLQLDLDDFWSMLGNDALTGPTQIPDLDLYMAGSALEPSHHPSAVPHWGYGSNV